MNYYPFHLGDYASHTAHLEPMEDLAYRRMLDLCYRTEAPLPTDWREIARLIRLRDQGPAIEAVLSEFFQLTDDGWINKRAAAEIQKMQDKQAKAKAAGSLGGKTKAANAEQSPSGRLADASQNPSERLATNTNTNTNTKQKQNLALGAQLNEPPAASRPIQGQHPSDVAGAPPRARKARASVASLEPPKSGFAWNAYSLAYRARYGTDPVRNSKGNAILCKLVDRIGAEEAPAVAEFYVSRNAQWYVQNGHALDYLLRDCEKLRTEWATGNSITATQARQLDRTQGNANVWGRLIDEEQAKERAANEC